MSFLAPLFLAGLAAIGLPILFHLIRRTPEGHREFSSLMFLSPSPPRLSRRSRLDQLWLLLLRVAILALLAAAFARPFLRAASELTLSSGQGRREAILIDTSASMRRGDLWRHAHDAVLARVSRATPEDQVAVYAFSDRLEPIVSFELWNETPAGTRRAMVEERLSKLAPSWRATDLGLALAGAADALEDAADSNEADRERVRQLVLISDLAGGSRLDALGDYEWPSRVRLAVENLSTPAATEAGLHALSLVVEEDAATEDGETSRDAATRLRVRVMNDVGGTREEFRLAWASADATAERGKPLSVYVPPGQSRVLRAPAPPAGAAVDRLILEGDDHDFDNTLFVAPREEGAVQFLYLGSDRSDDPESLRFYAERALEGGSSRKIELLSAAPGEAVPQAAEKGRAMVMAAGGLDEAHLAWLDEHLAAGGRAVYVAESADDAGALARLSQVLETPLVEAPGDDYALLATIDFRHPVFAPFADPRYSDFTKIHFWNHRRLGDEAKLPSGSRVLARFDDGSPWLVEFERGEGRLYVLTSGWTPAESQLAMSSKFVPLLSSLLAAPAGAVAVVDYQVGEPVTLAAAKSARMILAPNGKEHALAAGETTFRATDEPGVYRLETPAAAGRGPIQEFFAVNLADSESRVAPLAVEELEQLGVLVGERTSRAEEAERERQLRDTELESRQKLWQWAIVAALALLIVETWLAARLSQPPRGAAVGA